MPNKVSTNISTMLNPFGPQWPSSTERTEESKPVGEQVQDALFGKKKPNELDEDEFPDVKELLNKLDGFRRKLAKLAGDNEDDYRLKLASGTIASIDGQGNIFLGIKFLREFQERIEVLTGALAHEIGHRPKRWNEYRAKKELNKAELESLCRYEETRADLFAGKGLAALDLSVEPMIRFLKHIEEGPHPEYFPAEMRAEVIREGFREQKSKDATRDKFKSIWPELDRQDIKKHIGDV